MLLMHRHSSSSTIATTTLTVPTTAIATWGLGAQPTDAQHQRGEGAMEPPTEETMTPWSPGLKWKMVTWGKKKGEEIHGRKKTQHRGNVKKGKEKRCTIAAHKEQK